MTDIETGKTIFEVEISPLQRGMLGAIAAYGEVDTLRMALKAFTKANKGDQTLATVSTKLQALQDMKAYAGFALDNYTRAMEVLGLLVDGEVVDPS